jgi:WhiB family transcriptional regulator, redox-sensing transcriptional regulator
LTLELGGPLPQWFERAACLGMDTATFFPDGSEGASTAALEVCGRCHVLDACGAYAATESVEWGVWGGTTEQDRRRQPKAA